jgi:hypothetical protein
MRGCTARREGQQVGGDRWGSSGARDIAGVRLTPRRYGRWRPAAQSKVARTLLRSTRHTGDTAVQPLDLLDSRIGIDDRTQQRVCQLHPLSLDVEQASCHCQGKVRSQM